MLAEVGPAVPHMLEALEYNIIYSPKKYFLNITHFINVLWSLLPTLFGLVTQNRW